MRRGGGLSVTLNDEILISFRQRPTATPGPCSIWWSTPLSLPEENATCPTSRPHSARDQAARHDKGMGTASHEYALRSSNRSAAAIRCAALYYLACLLEGGEDPQPGPPRLIPSASEDGAG